MAIKIERMSRKNENLSSLATNMKRIKDLADKKKHNIWMKGFICGCKKKEKKEKKRRI